MATRAARRSSSKRRMPRSGSGRAARASRGGSSVEPPRGSTSLSSLTRPFATCALCSFALPTVKPGQGSDLPSGSRGPKDRPPDRWAAELHANCDMEATAAGVKAPASELTADADAATRRRATVPPGDRAGGAWPDRPPRLAAPGDGAALLLDAGGCGGRLPARARDPADEGAKHERRRPRPLAEDGREARGLGAATSARAPHPTH